MDIADWEGMGKGLIYFERARRERYLTDFNTWDMKMGYRRDLVYDREYEYEYSTEYKYGVIVRNVGLREFRKGKYIRRAS